MSKVLTVEYEVFEELEIKVLSVVDSDRDEVLNMFHGREAEELYNKLITVADNEHEINEQPTIEAVPVAYGEWIYENYTWHCGVCGFHPFKGYIPKEPGFNFCPNCGAKMKGGAE